jgi:4'-phosphopantetheinyl transferase
VAEPPEAAGLHFNLSHTTGLVTCLVGRMERLGVDTENTQRPMTDLMQLARRYFAPAEVAALDATAEHQRRELFFRFWTLKESYIKARGIGLSLGLSRFAFAVSGDGATVKFETDFEDDPDAWDFRLFPVGDYLIATSVKQAAAGANVIIEDATDPLAKHRSS